MRRTIRENAVIFYQNALVEAEGNHVLAGLICADEAARFWNMAGSGFSREGVRPVLPHRDPPEPILSSGGV